LNDRHVTNRSAPPGDLEPGEADLASLLGSLDRAPPAALGPRVMAAYEPAPSPGFRVPRGPFALVAAALVLLLVGGIFGVSLAARDAEVRRPPAPAAAPTAPVEEPQGPLYRGLETFQSLDVGRPDTDEPLNACGEHR